MSSLGAPNTAYRPAALAGVLSIGVALHKWLGLAKSRRFSAYLALRVAECLTLATFGVYLLISPEPLSPFAAVIYGVTGMGGVILCSGLRTSGALPTWLITPALMGHGVLLAGVVAEVASGAELASSSGIAFLAPGSVFTVMFPVLLVLRGVHLLQHTRPVTPGAGLPRAIPKTTVSPSSSPEAP